MLGVGRQKFSGGESYFLKYYLRCAYGQVASLLSVVGCDGFTHRPWHRAPRFWGPALLGPRAFGVPRFWGPAQLSPITTRY